MRRGHGSTKVPNVKLKPVPKTGNYPKDTRAITYDANATSGTARDALKHDTRPFSGMQICCTGVKDKVALLGKARELGAVCSNDFTDLTTHLVADAPGSAKYDCALKLGIPVLTSDWILDTHTQWLAGVDIDPEECVSEHLLPPLKGVVLCATRLTNAEDRQRITKSAVRLGAVYQAHMDKAATHLLIGPDDAENVDSQKLQWVMRLNEKRRKEQSEEPPIHVVWDSWLLHCAVSGSRVPEAEFAYSENNTRPDPPKDIERVLRRSSNKKPAKVYVTASSVGASAGGKEILEKAKFRKGAPAESVWNTILSASQGSREPDSFVLPTQMQLAPPSTPPRSTSPLPISSAPPPVINVEDSATEDEDESLQEKTRATSPSRMGPKSTVSAAQDPPTPVVPAATPQSTVHPGATKMTSMVSRLNSLRGSAFQLGAGGTSDHNAPSSTARTLARVASIANPSQGPVNPVTTTNDSDAVPAPPATATPKVFAGKRIAPVGEARVGLTLYAALRAHGAVIVGEPEDFDPKGKGKAKDDDSIIALPQEEVDYYIVRLASESARNAHKLGCYDKFRTDCWVEHCIFEDRLCLPEENITYSPLKIQLPVPGTENIKLHWTGLNNEQESAAKRLVKVLGISVTETFAKRVNTHLLCGSKIGIKYDKALQWKTTLVDMDWLYDIAKDGRIPGSDNAPAQPYATGLPGNDTTAGPSIFGRTNLHTTSEGVGSGNSPLFGTPNGLLGAHAPPAEATPVKQSSAAINPTESERSPDKSKASPNVASSGGGPGPASSSNTKGVSGVSDATAPNSQSKDAESDREREAHRNQLADSLGALLKKHQLEENAPPDQPRKRIRPLQRQKLGSGVESGSNSRSRSLSEKVSSISLQTRASDPEYVSPLEAMESVQEETLQVHYMDPNQHAAKEGLLKLLDGSSQFPEADIINLDTQTEPELSQEPAPPPVPAKRKRGGATGSASSGRRKSQRKA
ncbi:hypothetical protein FRC10_002523 [Ceratobasidium sp. 414]|nr:hypothetical protein FRC10_002523 [Ceratobasidium sp. 414]